jgi:hypothetical protein
MQLSPAFTAATFAKVGVETSMSNPEHANCSDSGSSTNLKPTTDIFMASVSKVRCVTEY